jgi:flagellar hook-associated protein 3 FlgL
MRISSQTLQLQWLADVYRRQASLARIQRQVTSGQRINTAADDPAGAGQVVALKQGIDRLANFGANAEAARRRLALEENSLAQFGDALSRVRELAVQAGGGVQTVETRTAIAAEMRELFANMVDVANSQDGEGRYLFAGNAVSTRPVDIVNGVATYNGDDGVRSQRIGDSRTIREGDPGSEIFFGIRDGNGTFAVAAGANTGTAFLQNATVTSPAAWVADTYTISFTTPTVYTVTNSGGAVVASGAWQPGGAVQFAGASVVLAGQPAAGDSFSVSPSANRSAFETVSRLIAALEGDSVTPQGRAVFQTALNDSLMSLDQVEGHLNQVRSTIGGRLSALDEQKSNNEELSIQLQSTLSTVRDVDYAAAITALEREMTSLEAAQKVFARTQTLSLFDVL